MTVSELKSKIILSSFRTQRTFYNDPPASPPTVPPPPPPPPAVPPTVPPPPPPPAGKVFTQEEVDKLMEGHRKTLQQTNKELIERLEAEKTNASLTREQKEELETRINTLSQQHLTKEQQTAEEFTKLKKKYDTDTKQLQEKEVVWKSRFESLMVDNGLAVGASEHGARSAKQLQMMFRNQAKVVEEVGDDGKPTGNYVAKMPVEVIDPKTKVKQIIELPIVEAIGKLRENDEFANLFNTDSRSGIGQNNHNRGGSGSNGQMPDFAKMSPEEYAEWRKKQPS